MPVVRIFPYLAQALWKELPSPVGIGLHAGDYSAMLDAASLGNLPNSPRLRHNLRGLPEVGDISLAISKHGPEHYQCPQD